ncbi:hypothetical protein ILUMI_03623 [Ignelater luminosus]|uniref:DUF5641 domain-containing protein n=1 Tax=Ignelater luminosus TaxID=2038154 RepID=A0A8K0DLE9_IGNLU|nr:hypothetical protein ILUMI_03623 [Ignelater luminosus]
MDPDLITGRRFYSTTPEYEAPAQHKLKHNEKFSKTFLVWNGLISDPFLTIEWYRVSFKQNPVDLLSRGMSPKELLTSGLWFKGPLFLKSDISHIIHNDSTNRTPAQELPKAETSLLAVGIRNETEFNLQFLNKYSCFVKLLRVTAFILRFVKNCRCKLRSIKHTGNSLSMNELKEAKLTKWKHATVHKIQPGDMVIIKDDNFPPLQWRMGRAKEIFPDEDSAVRVVTVQTVQGEFKRAVNKLFVTNRQRNRFLKDLTLSTGAECLRSEKEDCSKLIMIQQTRQRSDFQGQTAYTREDIKEALVQAMAAFLQICVRRRGTVDSIAPSRLRLSPYRFATSAEDITRCLNGTLRQNVPVKWRPLRLTAAVVAKLACTKALRGSELPPASAGGSGLAAPISRSMESIAAGDRSMGDDNPF